MDRKVFCLCGEKRRSAGAESTITSHFLDLVALDHVKLGPSNAGYQYALMIIDHYSKFIVTVLVRDITAKTTAEIFLKSFVRPYGYPERVLTDQGPAFESLLFTELCKIYGCRKLRTTPYHPQSNGLCKRANQTLLEMIRSIPLPQRLNWPALLPELTYLYNNMEQASTGYTPYYLLFGRLGKLPADLELNTIPEDALVPQTEWVMEHKRRIEEAKEVVERKMEEVHRRQEDYYNRDALAEPLQVGDRVWKKNTQRKNKLDNKWELIPYIVINLPTPDTVVYEIKKEEGIESRTIMVHRNQLKLCVSKAMSEGVQRETIPAIKSWEDANRYPLRDPVELLLFMGGPFPSSRGVVDALPPASTPVNENVMEPKPVQENEDEINMEISSKRPVRSTRGVKPLRFRQL
ncbi:uncharacterized protein K02A2.6-like [Pseudophryne corroboree]|uniref:uncharacterized protein K02A2.6-like n=1 Tax=Pseudophryne corroboree TaxID=495146 RepID=UPI00308217A5